MAYFGKKMTILPKMYRIIFCVLGLFVFLSTNVTAAQDTDIPKLIVSEHPLLEKIWDVDKQRFIDRKELKQRVLQASQLLLGETHDNTDHHKYQAWVLKQLAGAGSKVIVAFEMINESQGELIKSRKLSDTKELLGLLNKVESGWQYESFYTPVFDTVISAGFPIVAANLDRKTIVKIVMKGSEHIPADLKKILDSSTLDKSQYDSLAKEIEESHCNMINQQMIDGMMAGQKVRDAVMALALARIDDAFVKVLIAGSGHARRDRGVPFYYLRNAGKKPGGAILSMSWIEVEEKQVDPREYAKRWNTDTLPFNYVWFTAAADRPDPCEEFRKHMHKKSKKGQKT